jgi:hypothetical protein
MNPKNCKNDAKKNLLAKDSSNLVGNNLNVDGNIVCTTIQKEVNLNILHHKEEKE